MSDDMSYLDDVGDESETALSEVMRLVDALTTAQAQVEQAEKTLENYKALERKLREETIPSFMRQHRLSNMELENGVSVEIEDCIAVNVPKDEQKLKTLKGFMEQYGGGDIPKEEISFTDADQEILDALQERGITYERKISINAQSLKAWFRRNLGLAKNSVAQFSPSQVPAEANLWQYRNTKITRKNKE